MSGGFGPATTALGGRPRRERPHLGGLMRRRTRIAVIACAAGMASALAAGAVGSGAQASVITPGFGDDTHLIPGDLLVSTSHYTNDPNIVAGQTILPPGSGSAGALAVAGGDYPYVFNNDS